MTARLRCRPVRLASPGLVRAALLLVALLAVACSDAPGAGVTEAGLCSVPTDCPVGQMCLGGKCKSLRGQADVGPAEADTEGDDADAEPVADAGEADAAAGDDTAVTEDVASTDAVSDGVPDAGPQDAAADAKPATCEPKGDESCNGQDDDCNGKTDETFPDQDGDGIADCVDDDVDGDSVPNGIDNCPKLANPDQDDTDFNGVGDKCDKDSDGDGLKDVSDNCPGVINQEQQDMDGDGQGDLCDDDLDGDGVPNAQDNCKNLYNEPKNGKQADEDEDGLGDACDDKDGDLVPWEQDNCPTIKNDTQTDIDKDGLGDACDPDMDNDKIPNVIDNCPTIPNPSQADTNGDGKGDACSGDADGDGCPDKLDCAPTDALNGCDNNGKGPKELCDGKDNNCNSSVDEGYGVGGECGLGVCSGGTVICGSATKSICSTELGGTNTKQLEKELCNSLDDNCDGVIPAEEQDADGDSFRVCDGDCDDDNPSVCPSANLCPEKCDGLDNDCNGGIDDGDVCTGLGEIIGFIYDATNPATVLKGSKVELRDATCTTPLLTQTVTATGKFSFPSVNGPQGLYCLKVGYPGDEDQKALNVQLGNSALGIKGYATVRQVDFGMKPFGFPFNYAGIAGKVWSESGQELKGAQVVIKASGNQIATDQADEYANYTVVALSPSTVEVSASANGFDPQTKTVTLKSNETLVVDFKLTKALPKTKCFVDSFEWLDNPGWTVQASCGQANVGNCPGWHRIDNSQTIKNIWAKAPNPANPTLPLVTIYGNNLEVLKAPDGTKHFWYGADKDGSFIGTGNKQGGYTGGHGMASNGLLTSPPIELLGFNKFVVTVQSWYEIEAQNPKSYDVMQIQVAEAGKNNWVNLKQLNPKSDNYNAAKAYTSGGFATVPVWVTEQIDLSSFKGKTIQVRFRFNSGDGLYNGYRGWGVDNVKFICTM